jgi:hypothetical protein
MINEKDREHKIIFHDIQVGTKESPLWRHWGYSKELDTYAYRPSDSCDFCKTESGTFFKTICHCGLPGGRQVGNMNLGINASWSPENGDFTIYCCEQCVDKLTQLVQEQDNKLLNHQTLVTVIKILRTN